MTDKTDKKNYCCIGNGDIEDYHNNKIQLSLEEMLNLAEKIDDWKPSIHNSFSRKCYVGICNEILVGIRKSVGIFGKTYDLFANYKEVVIGHYKGRDSKLAEFFSSVKSKDIKKKNYEKQQKFIKGVTSTRALLSH